MSTQHVNSSDEVILAGPDGPDVVASQASPQGNRLAILVALISLYILWGTTYLGMRVALDSFPPFLMAGIRFICAGAVMLIFLRIRGAAWPTRREWLGTILIGFLLLVCGNGGVVFAEQWVSSGLSAVAVGAMPLWAALLGGFFGRWPSRLEWGGLTVGFIGLILLNLGDNFMAIPLGMVVLLIAPFCWALGSVLSHHVPLPKGSMASATQLLCGGVMALLIGLGSGERITHLPSLQAIWALIFLIVGGSLVAFTAFGYLLNHVRPALATSYAYVNPVVAVALGVWLLDEKVTLFGILAIGVILIGVLLVTLGRDQKR